MPVQVSSRRTIFLTLSVLLIAEVHQTPKSSQFGVPNCAFHSESMISPSLRHQFLTLESILDENPTQSPRFQFNSPQLPSTKLNFHDQHTFRHSIASNLLKFNNKIISCHQTRTRTNLPMSSQQIPVKTLHSDQFYAIFIAKWSLFFKYRQNRSKPQFQPVNQHNYSPRFHLQNATKITSIHAPNLERQSLNTMPFSSQFCRVSVFSTFQSFCPPDSIEDPS